MGSKKNTKRIIAGFMLVVFAFSITPRIVLHSWFAGHKDTAGKTLSLTPHLQFTKAVYHCNCDNIVAESPFTDPGNTFETFTVQPFSPHKETNIRSFYSIQYFSFSLRGPPANC